MIFRVFFSTPAVAEALEVLLRVLQALDVVVALLDHLLLRLELLDAALEPHHLQAGSTENVGENNQTVCMQFRSDIQQKIMGNNQKKKNWQHGILTRQRRATARLNRTLFGLCVNRWLCCLRGGRFPGASSSGHQAPHARPEQASRAKFRPKRRERP